MRTQSTYNLLADLLELKNKAQDPKQRAILSGALDTLIQRAQQRERQARKNTGIARGLRS